MAGTTAPVSAVDVAPHGQRIQRDISQLTGCHDAVAVEHRFQMRTVARVRLAAGAIDMFPVIGGPRGGACT
jgi:hypothetical protein